MDSVKKLEAAGVPQKQAEAHVRLFSQIVEETVCSKQDLLETESRLEVKLKEIQGHFEVKLKELEFQIKETEGRLRIEIEQLRRETGLQIERVKNDLIKWYIGTSLVSLGLITGIITSLIKLMHL